MSIRHKPGLPSQPGYCNLGSVLRVMCWANLLMLGWSLARAPTLEELPATLLSGAGLVEPVAFLALGLLCALRLPLQAAGTALRCAVASLVTGALTWALLAFAHGVTVLADEVTLLQPLLLMSAGAGLIEYLLALRRAALVPAAAEARLDALQARIRPHFLFNSLNAVLALIGQDPARAERVLEDLAELFRALLGDHRRLVPLDGELELCRRYLAIEQERLGGRLQVDWRLEEPLPAAWLPPLLLQPLVENAVVHGIEPFPPAGLARLAPDLRAIRLEVASSGGRLRLAVENPVAPRQDVAAVARRRSHGSGLANVRERLALHYDVEASLEVQQVADRFQVLLHLPLGRPQ